MSKPTYFRVAVKDAAGATGTAAHHIGQDIAVTKGARRGAVGYASYMTGKDIDREQEGTVAKAPDGKLETVEESRILTDKGWSNNVDAISRAVNDLDGHQGRYKGERGEKASRALDVEFALSTHLSKDGQRNVETKLAEAIRARYETFVVTARHREKGHNPHAHMLISRYRYDDGQITSYVPEFSKDYCGPRDIEKAAAWIRRTAAEITNSELEREGKSERVSHLSYKDQGLDIKPREYLSKSEYQRREKEQVAGETDRGKQRAVARSPKQPSRGLANEISQFAENWRDGEKRTVADMRADIKRAGEELERRIERARERVRQVQDQRRIDATTPSIGAKIGDIEAWQKDTLGEFLHTWKSGDRAAQLRQAVRNARRAACPMRDPTKEERGELRRAGTELSRSKRLAERLSSLDMELSRADQKERVSYELDPTARLTKTKLDALERSASKAADRGMEMERAA